MNMARYEQETIISFNEEEKTAGIYTHNKVLRQKLAAHAQQTPAPKAGESGTGQAGGLQARQSVPQRTGS